MSEVTKASSGQSQNPLIYQRKSDPCGALSKAASSAWNCFTSSCSNCWYHVTYDCKIKYIKVVIAEENLPDHSSEWKEIAERIDRKERIAREDLSHIIRAVEGRKEKKESKVELYARVNVLTDP